MYGGIRYLELFNLYSVINDRINFRTYNAIFERLIIL